MKKLKEKLSAKLSKNGGFTLVEMLIVVAIIAILVAVSIPLVGSALENARKATDASNERSFKAALVSGYILNQAGMSDDTIKVDATNDDGTTNRYAYDAANGKVVDVTATLTGYGKSKDIKTNILFGVVTAKGEVHMIWAPSTNKPSAITANGTNLVSPEMVSGS